MRAEQTDLTALVDSETHRFGRRRLLELLGGGGILIVGAAACGSSAGSSATTAGQSPSGPARGSAIPIPPLSGNGQIEWEEGGSNSFSGTLGGQALSGVLSIDQAAYQNDLTVGTVTGTLGSAAFSLHYSNEQDHTGPLTVTGTLGGFPVAGQYALDGGRSFSGDIGGKATGGTVMLSGDGSTETATVTYAKG